MEEDAKKIKLIFICEKAIFHFFEDYINTFHHIFNVEIFLYFQQDFLLHRLKRIGIEMEDRVLYIFIQSIPDCILNDIDFYISHQYKLALLNTEQLSRKEYAIKINAYHPYIYRIDYSITNLLIVANELSKIYLPYQLHHNELILKDREKDKMVCMIYPHKSPRRHKIVELLKARGIQVDFISGFGRTRDVELFRYKILINIHFDEEYQIFEELRCNRCIFHQMLVITEKSLYDDLHLLRRHFLSVSYEEMVDKVVDVVRNYDLYHTNLFRSFDKLIKVYEEDLKEYAIQNISYIWKEK